jgi:acyl-CoA hydrolase
MLMEPQKFVTFRLVKSEDLNHHNTLFAGRCAEWFVESGFIAAASVLPAKNIVCLKMHGLEFSKPINLGDIARFESKIVHTGRTSLKVYIQLIRQSTKELIVSGFITFVNVDQNGISFPHGIKLELTDPQDQALKKIAETLK